jgi:hypothetical protein
VGAGKLEGSNQQESCRADGRRARQPATVPGGATRARIGMTEMEPLKWACDSRVRWLNGLGAYWAAIFGLAAC